MPPDNAHGPVGKPALDPRDRAAVARLIALCNAHDGLDLKLDLDAAPAEPDGPDNQQANHFLRDADGEIAGYCAIDPADPIELCGAVHPNHRRRGLGRALLAAATAECRRRGRTRAYLLCEDASAAGRAFVAAAGGVLDFSEHRMELGARPAQPPSDDSLQLERAGPAGVDTLARVQASAFGDPEDERRERIAAEIDQPHVSFYLARLNGAPAGSLKLLVADGRASIYAFGVVPEYRRRGLGRRMLDGAIDLLHADGLTRIGLEVETDNAPAIALYRDRGFHVTTTYGYYRLDLG